MYQRLADILKETRAQGIDAEHFDAGGGFEWLVYVREDGSTVVLSLDGCDEIIVAEYPTNPRTDSVDADTETLFDANTDDAALLFVRVVLGE